MCGGALWLLVCEPPHRTVRACSAAGASKPLSTCRDVGRGGGSPSPPRSLPSPPRASTKPVVVSQSSSSSSSPAARRQPAPQVGGRSLGRPVSCAARDARIVHLDRLGCSSSRYVWTRAGGGGGGFSAPRLGTPPPPMPIRTPRRAALGSRSRPAFKPYLGNKRRSFVSLCCRRSLAPTGRAADGRRRRRLSERSMNSCRGRLGPVGNLGGGHRRPLYTRGSLPGAPPLPPTVPLLAGTRRTGLDAAQVSLAYARRPKLGLPWIEFPLAPTPAPHQIPALGCQTSSSRRAGKESGSPPLLMSLLGRGGGGPTQQASHDGVSGQAARLPPSPPSSQGC